MKNYLKIWITFLLLLLITASTSIAQTRNTFNERDNKYTLLGLKRAKANFEASNSEYERQAELFNQGLINKVE